MKLSWNICCAVGLTIVLTTGTLAAPVGEAPSDPSTKETVDDNVKEGVQTEVQDQTANELESLSRNDETQNAAAAVEFPEAPSEPESADVAASSKEAASSASNEVVGDVESPEMSLPAKRQFAQPAAETYQTYQAPEVIPAYDREVYNTMLSNEVPVDLSPRAIAEYLIETNDFDGFNQALQDLVDFNILSAAEVYQFQNTVGWQYDTLLNEIENARRMSLEDLLQRDPLDYLTRQGPIYADLEMEQTNPALIASQQQQQQPMDFQDLGIQSTDFSDLQFPSFDATPQQIGGMKAIPFAERRTERTQKLLLAKQQNLGGLLDLLLGADYSSQPQETEQYYNTDYLENENPLYDMTYEQLMEYLGANDVSEPAAVAQQVPEESSQEESEASNDVASELDELPVQDIQQQQQSQDTKPEEATSPAPTKEEAKNKTPKTQQTVDEESEEQSS